jgi:hypothetical protein
LREFHHVVFGIRVITVVATVLKSHGCRLVLNGFVSENAKTDPNRVDKRAIAILRSRSDSSYSLAISVHQIGHVLPNRGKN